MSGRSAPFEGSTNEEPSWRADAGILQVVILTISLWTYVPGNACTMLTQCCTPLKLGPFFLLYTLHELFTMQTSSQTTFFLRCERVADSAAKIVACRTRAGMLTRIERWIGDARIHKRLRGFSACRQARG